jgi:hypothetical protein
MAHAGTTLDLGRSRQTTKAGSGWFKAPLAVALAVVVGLAVGTAAWAMTRSQSAATTQVSVSAAAHERIEAHQALVGTQVDRSTDAIEAHRLAAADAAASAVANSGLDQIEAHRTYVANTAMGVYDHRLDAIETQGGLPQSIVDGASPVDTPWGPRPATASAAAKVLVVGRAGTQGVVTRTITATAADAIGGYPWTNPLP